MIMCVYCSVFLRLRLLQPSRQLRPARLAGVGVEFVWLGVFQGGVSGVRLHASGMSQQTIEQLAAAMMDGRGNRNPTPSYLRRHKTAPHSLIHLNISRLGRALPLPPKL